MRNFLLILALATLPALAQPPVQVQTGSSSPFQRNGALSARDRQHLVQAAEASLAQQRLSQLAIDKTDDVRLRNYAEKVRREQSRIHDDLLSLARRQGVALPTTVSGPQQANFDRLFMLTGPGFDREYAATQMAALEDSRLLYQNGASRSDNRELRALFARYRPVMVSTLNQAKDLP